MQKTAMTKKKELSPRDILQKPYARVLIPEEDGTYSAEILEFPGCYAEGDTAAEAIVELENAAVSWIEATLGQHQEIPEPLVNYEYSGKINLRLPKSIHKQAARFAQNEDVSLNQFFASAIAAKVGAEDLCEHLMKRIESRLMSNTSIMMFQQSVNLLVCSPDASGYMSDIKYLGASSPWMVFPSLSSKEPTPTVISEK
jgi:predicted RNase H-like HicB family nuclease